jgi:methionine sulfoxide reductase heme-binding subunit
MSARLGDMNESTTLGILCGWGTLILGLSYDARSRIGVQRWRRLHRLTAVVWLASIAHALGEGSDAGEAWFLLGAGALVVPALTLLAVRTTSTKGVTA